MGKRSNFERRPADFYPTPRAAVLPLIPHLRGSGIRTFVEPCCGEGDLVQHLESFGLRCLFAGDIRTTGQDAFALNHYSGADAGITNPPLSRRTRKPYDCELLHDLIEHFLDIAPTTPTWLLIHYGWSATRQAAKYLPHCSDIVVLPRVKWIEGSEHTGKDDHAWYRFDSRHRCGPVFHNNRGQGEAIPRRTRVCDQCGKRYEPQRSSSQFCSEACRQRAHYTKVSVRLSVRTEPTLSTAIEQKNLGEEFRYVLHADVPRFTAEGWETLPALDGTHHGEYSVLMRRVGQRG